MMNKLSWAVATEGGGVLRVERAGAMEGGARHSRFVTLRQNDLLHLDCVTLLMKCIRNKSEF